MSWVAVRLSQKFGVQHKREVEKLLHQLTDKGVNWADAWATQQEQKPSGQEKLQVASEFIIEMAKAYGLPKLAQEALVKRVEGHLVMKNGKET